MNRTHIVLTAVCLAGIVLAGDLGFSDPAKQKPAPRGAAGYPSRDANLDALPGFRKPPAGYGEVAFYWWLGDPLTKERLTWQLDQLKGKGVAGLQVNYAHSDKGGRSYGLTFPSEPPLFSGDWWNLFGWFEKAAWSRGMAVSLSDYTLGPGQGWYFDEIVKDYPALRGAALDKVAWECAGPRECAWELPANVVSVAAVRAGGGFAGLTRNVKGRTLSWQAPQGDWQVVAVVAKPQDSSLDPMHPLSGRQLIEKFFQRFEKLNPAMSGKGLNFFFSDELSFGVRGFLWNKNFAAEFRKRKGYDVVPELAALFVDIGPRTPKIRLDYSDVMVSLQEENFFKPLYDWHRSRGMLYGCDHGGRGRNVVEFGDYFRTQRWMTGPGNDNPNLTSDVIKNKVASSITHLYERPRTWVEGYYNSGWGTTPAALADATFRNFVMGQNLLTLHGLYYSTHGGWWEWAPPCNHFRMPYWSHMGVFLGMTERLSYLLSQGAHRADVAIVYPVAPMEAGMGGKESVDAAFALAKHLYEHGIDLDFIDFESVARARVEQKQLKVSGEQYRVLVLPAMQAVRHSTVEKALEFQKGGGIVLVLGALPRASERVGRDDPELARIVSEIGGGAVRASNPEQAFAAIDKAFTRDFTCPGASVLHRRIGPRDVYMVHAAAKDTVCEFRATGAVELWDPWTGNSNALGVLSQSSETTRIRMPLDRKEAQLIVFRPGQPRMAAERPSETPRVAPLDGSWEFELKPTLDNRWGDFRLPASNTLIGAEARRFRYAEETAENPGWETPAFDDSKWAKTTYSYGQRFWKLGPLPEKEDTRSVETELVRLKQMDPAVPVTIAGKAHYWRPYEFSMRWGVEGDPGHQGYHGLKGEVGEDFIALGALKFQSTTTVYEREEGGSRYYLWTSVAAPRDTSARVLSGGLKPAKAWLNSAPAGEQVALRAGANPLLLRYDQPGRGHYVLLAAGAPLEWEQTYPLSSTWYNRPGVLPFDTRPQAASPAGWYRFAAPPGFRALTVAARGKVRAWANGKEMKSSAGGTRLSVEKASAEPVLVALRVEQERGNYGGAAFSEPVALECERGVMPAGDWSSVDGLASYSGGAWYRRQVKLTPEEARGSVVLSLGEVAASAEVHINGKPAGVKVAPPWKVDVSKLVKAGDNWIEILVYNTLANHYMTIPTQRRGSPVSGLLGPVTLEMSRQP